MGFLSERAGIAPARETSDSVGAPAQRYVKIRSAPREFPEKWRIDDAWQGDRRFGGAIRCSGGGYTHSALVKTLDRGISGWYSGASNTKPSHPYQVADGRVSEAFDVSLPAYVEGLAILRNPASLRLCRLLSTMSANHGRTLVRRVSRRGHGCTPRNCHR